MQIPLNEDSQLASGNSFLFTKNISIVVPAYNEESRIRPFLEDISSFIFSNDLEWEAIIVVDGNDNTDNIVNSYHNRFPFIKTIKSSNRSGMGGAIKRGIRTSKNEYIILMDADNSTRIQDIMTAIAPLDGLEKFDIINFDRYSLKENMIPLKRIYLSRGLNTLLKAIFRVGVNDTQCDYKILKRSSVLEIVNRITITNAFFLSLIFIYAKMKNMSIIEVPILYKHSDGSKFNVIPEIAGHGISIFAFKLRHSRFYKHVPEWARNLYFRKFKWI